MEENLTSNNTTKGVKKQVIIAIVAIAVALMAVTIVFADEIIKRVKPELNLVKVFGSAKKDLENVKTDSDRFIDILDSNFEQTVEFSITDVSIDGNTLDANIKSILPMLLFQNVWKQDRSANKIQNEINIFAAGSKVIGTQLYLTDDIIAANVPELFPYYLTLNPKAISQQIENSMLSETINSTHFEQTDDELYNYYKQIFEKPQRFEKVDILEDLPLLLTGTEYSYNGKKTITTDTNDSIEYDDYSILIKEDSFNQYLEAIKAKIKASLLYKEREELQETYNLLYDYLTKLVVQGDTTVYIGVSQKSLARFEVYIDFKYLDDVDFSVDLLGDNNIFDSTTITLEKKDVDKIILNIESDFNNKTNNDLECALKYKDLETNDYTDIVLDRKYDTELESLNNFRLLLNLNGEIDMQKFNYNADFTGDVLKDEDKGELLLNFKNIVLEADVPGQINANAQFTLKYQLNALTDTTFGIEQEETKNITEFTVADVYQIYSTIMQNPVYAQIMSGL